MNKKIKLIELLQKSANKEELPKKIYFDGIIFELDEDGTYKGAGDLLVDSINFNLSNLNDYVEILEDNTEEIEELEYYCIGQEKSANLTKIIDKIEEIRVAINQIRKDLNND